ncbi:MAG: ferredoxin reductase, partial [Betaproteobacteria bacterium]
MTTLSVRVQRRLIEAEGICSFELVSADGAPLPAFTAGAHIDVHLGAGLIRQYSLCNDPAERHRYCIAVLLETQSRGGSQAMHEKVQEGQALTISAPRNHFPLVAAKHSLLIAGGIGITPILAMARTLHSQGATFELHYCGRSSSRMAFLEELNSSTFKVSVQIHADDGKGYEPFNAQTVLGQMQPETHLYVCGPGGFMN